MKAATPGSELIRDYLIFRDMPKEIPIATLICLVGIYEAGDATKEDFIAVGNGIWQQVKAEMDKKKAAQQQMEF